MSDESSKKVVYDPLTEILKYYSDKKPDEKKGDAPVTRSLEETLRYHIIDGEKKDLETNLDQALKKYSALDIINTILLEGMKTVGELFGKGEMQLPFVLQSAEVMKKAVAYLEPHMPRTESAQKGTLVLATVKGDVHDIGKNLVDIILTNNGYKVVNLGIKCPIDAMLAAVEEHHANAVGMSGLLVKSTLIMKENLEVMTERVLKIPVLLGGAALTKRYVDEDLRQVFREPLFYCEDAFAGLRAMEQIMRGEVVQEKAENILAIPAEASKEIIKRLKIVRHKWHKALGTLSDEDFSSRTISGTWSVHNILAHIVGWATILTDWLNTISRGEAGAITLYDENRFDEVNASSVKQYASLDRASLTDLWDQKHGEIIQFLDQPDCNLRVTLQGTPLWKIISEYTYMHEHHHLEKLQAWIARRPKAMAAAPVSPRRSAVPPAEAIPQPPFLGTRIVETIQLNTVFPFINEVALFRGQWQFVKGAMTDEAYVRFIEEKVRPVFDYWKQRSIDEKLLIPKVVYGYFPCQSDGNDLIVYHDDARTERLRFHFPRQAQPPYLCLSDFFASVDSGRMDILGAHVVTVGAQASDFSLRLFGGDSYSDYLYFHGLSVETAEALAEYWHRKIREELHIHQDDHAEIKKWFQQKYQGSRYSFGYPACPDLEDQKLLFELLRPERIGVTLSDEWQMVPEQSTSAIIVHHPKAKYFNV